MIITYNKEHVGDVLMVTLKESSAKRMAERRGNVARVYAIETGETLAWNIFEVQELFEVSGNGQIFLTDEEVAILNDTLIKSGFSETLMNDSAPKFVVGEILDFEAHPDSDHLNICQVAIEKDPIQTIQIVAGAPNVTRGLKTIVALPGAMMPNGSFIFEGELRGVASYGMMCSPRELALPNAPQVRGVIELDDRAIIGEAFSPAKHWKG